MMHDMGHEVFHYGTEGADVACTEHIDVLTKAGLIFSGRHPVHPIMQILELPRDVHPFFVGTQAHPCLTSRPLRPSPMFTGLVEAALKLVKKGE